MLIDIYSVCMWGGERGLGTSLVGLGIVSFQGLFCKGQCVLSI